jgi:hypothetical protein
MNYRTVSLFIFLIFSTACEKEEQTTQCYECKRVIQTFDADGVLFLRQDDSFTKCNISASEMRQIEQEGTHTDQVTSGTNAGGKKEYMTTCTKS